MSHWARLVGLEGSAEHLQLCNGALAEINTETRRRQIARLEAWIEAHRDDRDLDRSQIIGLELAVLVLEGKV